MTTFFISVILHNHLLLQAPEQVSPEPAAEEPAEVTDNHSGFLLTWPEHDISSKATEPVPVATETAEAVVMVILYLFHHHFQLWSAFATSLESLFNLSLIDFDC